MNQKFRDDAVLNHCMALRHLPNSMHGSGSRLLCNCPAVRASLRSKPIDGFPLTKSSACVTMLQAERRALSERTLNDLGEVEEAIVVRRGSFAAGRALVGIAHPLA